MMKTAPRPSFPYPPPAVLIGLLLASLSSAEAQVYKGIGPDGRIFYSDQPIDGAAPVAIPAVAPTDDAAEDDAGDGEQSIADEDSAAPGPYTSLDILAPAEGETIRDESRAVGVSLLLDPALQEGHQLRIEVDGAPATGHDGKATQVRLNGLPLGSHRLQVRVLDADGGAVAQSAVVHFHVRRPLPDAALP